MEQIQYITHIKSTLPVVVNRRKYLKMKYIVEMKRSYNDYFDNWLDDYIEAETEYEALELAKQWLIDHGYDGDVDDLIYKISQF